MSDFSNFIRDASPEEKKKIYLEVMRKAELRQRNHLGFPYGKVVVDAYNEQPIDDPERISLEEMIDNAIGLTIRKCWGLNDK